MKNEKSTIHEGHRQRLKNRFLENGFDSFEPHNILEMLLFYSIPRRDTNEIAHALLERFGSIKNVLDADFDELIKVNGISENSATLIKMLPKIANVYVTEAVSQEKIFDTAEKIGEYFLRRYIGETNEIVYAMLLNNGYEVLSVVKIHEGSVNSAQITPRKILDYIVKYNASMVVLAHNHPNGNPIPSMEDIETTGSLMSAFNLFEVKLLEHFVVAGNDFYPIINSTSSLKYQNKDNRDLFRKSEFNKF